MTLDIVYTQDHDGDDHSPMLSNQDLPKINTTVLEGTSESNERLISQDRSPTRGGRLLRYTSYGLHSFLIAIHVVLVWMLFTHPEHRFSVAVNNTTAVIALKAFLQAFYLVYTAVLVLMTQRLVISAVMEKRQKLTAIHDICGAWNGIGAAMSALWQQTRIVSSPLTILLTLAYFSCICALHIISSSVIQFEAFNNTAVQTVSSTLAWPSPSVNLSALNWYTVSTLTALWPMLPTAKGLTDSVLYDIPSSDHAYTGAVVNATTITADCGLLSNLSVATLNSTTGFYDAEVNGLGEIYLPVAEAGNLVLSILYPQASPPQECLACNNYLFYQVTTQMNLENVTGDVLQVQGESPVRNTTSQDYPTTNLSTTSYFVACTLNPATTTAYLPMQDGRTIAAPPSDNGLESWTTWSPGPVTNLTQALYIAQNPLAGFGLFCQEIELSIGSEECAYMAAFDVYLNYLLNISWISSEASTTGQLTSPKILERKDMEHAVAQTAAFFVWLAGGSGADNGGFQQADGMSPISNPILELRLNVDMVPVMIGLVTSLSLLVILIWMLYDSHPTHSRTSSVLELMWISAQSTALQDLMKMSGHSSPDQLRLTGMKIEVCLTDLLSEPTRSFKAKHNNIEPDLKTDVPKWQNFALERGFSNNGLCYALHGILLAFHVILITFLVYHPEHHVIMSSDNAWISIILSMSLQAFYVMFTALLVFITQQLAISAILTRQEYLTGVQDVAQAWNSVGSAVYTLWQQTKMVSSFLPLLGVAIYLGSISTLHIASSTIMQFTAFNSTSTISVSSTVTWPNNTVLTNETWSGAIEVVPPSTLLANIQTNGWLNNTLYDILDTANPTFVNTTVNATSLQIYCGLLPNLTFSNSGGLPTLNFSVDGLGSESLVLTKNNIEQQIQIGANEIVYLTYDSFANYLAVDQPSRGYLFFLITTNIELDGSIDTNTMNISVNIAQDDVYPLTAYLAGCSLSSQSELAHFDLQTGTLSSRPSQQSSQSWGLLSSVTNESSVFTNGIDPIFESSGFGICPQYGFTGCSMLINTSVEAPNNTIYTLTPNQLEQVIGDTVAGILWMGGQLGSINKGFDRIAGESQVTQVITAWRLNVNEVPVAFASTASLILFILMFYLIKTPSRMRQPHTSVTGLSVLEIIWIVAHSKILQEQMEGVHDGSLDHLRKEGMFKICLGDIGSSEVVQGEEEAFLT